jgi:hypothetical protein
MFRVALLNALQAYLSAVCPAGVKVLKQEDDETIEGPYCLVRVGSMEDAGNGQAEIWDANILVAVSQDADSTTIETAEATAAEVFAVLADPEEIKNGLYPEIVVSWWQPLDQEAAMAGTRWQHIAGFRLIASPAST